MVKEVAASNRKIGIYSIAGILAAIIIIASVFASGIELPGEVAKPTALGTLVVSIKDAPVNLENLLLTINGVYIQSSEDDKWVELKLDEGASEEFNLLALTDTSLQLSEDETIPAGDYSKIRLEVTSPLATYTDQKGTYYKDRELKVPSGHIDIKTSFQVVEGEVTGLLIDMEPDTAAISQSGNFRPIIKMTIVNPLPTPTPTPSPSPSTSAP